MNVLYGFNRPIRERVPKVLWQVFYLAAYPFKLCII